MKHFLVKTLNQPDSLSNKLTLISRLYQKYAHLVNKSVPAFPSQNRYNITICHEKKFIWYRVAKVGTRTIFNMFSENNIILDAEHAMFCHYPIKHYKDYFKFGFVRNPWDRLVSCWKSKVIETNYFNFKNNELKKMQQFNNFVEYVDDLDISTCDHHLRLQSKLIDLNDVDFVGRFENFISDLTKVIENIELSSTKIGHQNASINLTPYKSFYNKSLIKKVEEIYSRDIQMFSYRYE